MGGFVGCCDLVVTSFPSILEGPATAAEAGAMGSHQQIYEDGN